MVLSAVEAFEAAITAARAGGPRQAPGPPDSATQGWTLAQAIAHCAHSVECSMTAYPKLRSGLFRATIGPLVKRKFLRAGRMSHDVGASIPGAEPIVRTVTLDQAADRAIAAIRAFAAHDGSLAPHLAYGQCTKDEYAQLHLLHVQDHLRSFGL
jgi:hypothetical protein